jgi:hypothetical protein
MITADQGLRVARAVRHHEAVTSTAHEHPIAVQKACVRCSHDADFEIAGVWLCVDCYHVAGSTCSGIGTLSTPVDPTC